MAPSPGAAAIEVANLVKRYDQFTALDGISLRIERGEFFGLLGPNGAGKTTLISTIAGLVRANSGRALVMGCLLYTSPSPRDGLLSRMPSSA